MIDTRKGGGHKGDDSLHDAPFENAATVTDTDEVKWRAGSGAGFNCLGVLQFNNNVTFNGSFSYPN